MSRPWTPTPPAASECPATDRDSGSGRIGFVDVWRRTEQRADGRFDWTSERVIKSAEVVGVQLVGGEGCDRVVDQCLLVFTVGLQAV